MNAEQWVQISADIDGEDPGDKSGSSVALSSDGAILAVGAWFNNGDFFENRGNGHVRVSIYSEGVWLPLGDDINGFGEDYFGWAVSLSSDGTMLAVGSYAPTFFGSVEVFRWDGNSWEDMGSSLSGGPSTNWFGYSVALSGDGSVVAVGAPQSDSGGTNSGMIRAFGWTGSRWDELGDDIIAPPSSNFGHSVALSADGAVLAGGGPNNDENGVNSGQVWISRWTGTRWVPQGSLINGFGSGDGFGGSVSLSGGGTVVAIGASRGNYCAVFRFQGVAWSQIGQTINGDSAGDEFGASVAISSAGDTVVVGGRSNDSNGANSGHARVFRLTANNEWVSVGQDLVGESPDDQFGWAVSISDDGTRIAVGAPNDDSSGPDAGHVRIFDLVCPSHINCPPGASPPSDHPTVRATPNPTPSTGVEQWVQLASDIDGEDPGDSSGSSLALSSNGTVLAVGAWLNNGDFFDFRGNGHVQVYVYSGEEWLPLGDDIDGPLGQNRFGWSVSLSSDGMLLAVGAYAPGSSTVGEVDVYSWSGSRWASRGSVRADFDDSDDWFGYSIALSGDGAVLAVGAPQNNRGGMNAGMIRAFGWTGSRWDELGSEINAPPSSNFGHTVALSSNGAVLAGGGPNNDDNGVDSGQVRIFRWGGTRWVHLGTLNGFGAGDGFGGSVSLSGDGTVVAIGAPRGSYCAVFGLAGADWSQIGQTINGDSAGDEFGSSVAVSSAGDIVVVGGRSNDSNGIDSGHARVFRLTANNEWVRVGQDLVGEAPEDQFGWVVSISDEGTRIAVGAPHNDWNGPDAGHVRVFELN